MVRVDARCLRHAGAETSMSTCRHGIGHAPQVVFVLLAWTRCRCRCRCLTVAFTIGMASSLSSLSCHLVIAVSPCICHGQGVAIIFVVLVSSWLGHACPIVHCALCMSRPTRRGRLRHSGGCSCTVNAIAGSSE